MNWSKYNYQFESTKYGSMLYNSFTNSFIKITAEIKEKLNEIKKNPNLISECSKELKDLLLSMKVIISETTEDQLNTIKLNSFLIKSSTKIKGFTIAPTLDCNFNCSYCYEIQKGSNHSIYMSTEIEDAIIKQITTDYKLNKSRYGISWYGGEPLLAINTIERISKELIANNVQFSSSMVTNGYLLNKENIEIIKQCKINSIQITIDGSKELHNKKRPHKINNDSYETIISNIQLLFELYNDVRLVIRVNIDNDNKDSYYHYINTLKEKFPKVYIYPALVTDYIDSESCNDTESCTMNKKDEIEFYLSQYENHNETNFSFFPKLTGLTNCVATHLYGWVIGPDGSLYKCWNDIGDKNRCIGNIIDNKITNVNLLGRYLVGVNPIDDKECKECFFLPVCGGGCPNQRLEKKYFQKKIDCCIVQKGKKLERFLEIQYEISEKNNELTQYKNSSVL